MRGKVRWLRRAGEVRRLRCAGGGEVFMVSAGGYEGFKCAGKGRRG